MTFVQQPGSKPPNPDNELGFISNAFEDAKKRNFKNPYDPISNAPVNDWDGRRRVVLNMLYRPVDYPVEEVVSKVRLEMKHWEISEVIVIFGDGSMFHLKE